MIIVNSALRASLAIYCCGAKYYVFENCVFIEKLSFGKPRLTHICGTLGSRKPFPFAVEMCYS